MSEANPTKEEKVQVLEWALWNETSYPLPAVDEAGAKKQAELLGMLKEFEDGRDPVEAWRDWFKSVGGSVGP